MAAETSSSAVVEVDTDRAVVMAARGEGLEERTNAGRGRWARLDGDVCNALAVKIRNAMEVPHLFKLFKR